MSDKDGTPEDWPSEWVPSQQSRKISRVPKWIAALAHEEYARHHGQSFVRLHNRGGFGIRELVVLLAQHIQHLKKERTTNWNDAWPSESPPNPLTDIVSLWESLGRERERLREIIDDLVVLIEAKDLDDGTRVSLDELMRRYALVEEKQ